MLRLAAAVGACTCGVAVPAAAATVREGTFVCSTVVSAGAHAFQPDAGSVSSLPAFLVNTGRGGMLHYNRDLCRRTTVRVPFAAGKLPGPYLFGSYNCVLDGRILIHVRYVFTGRHLDRAQLAVRLYAKRTPIFYGTTKARGVPSPTGGEQYAVRFWISDRCYDRSR